MSTAKCVSCGEYKTVCCDYAIKNGVHIDAICVDCCQHVKIPIFDGACIAGGVYERCGCET